MSNTNKHKDTLLSYAHTYNSSIKLLARIYALKNKGTFDEEKALRNNKRLNIVIEEEPMWLLENTGMYILKYGDVIKNREWEKMIEMDFEEEQQAYKQSEDGSKPEHTKQAMRGKIDFIKSIFINSSEKERVVMMDAVVDMLSAYCKYALYIKRHGL